MNRPLKRLLSGFGLLLAVMALAATATTSVFAFHTATTQSTATNGGPLNVSGTVSPASITPGGSATYAAIYSFTAASPAAGSFLSGASAPAGLALTGSTVSSQNSNIGTMFQQWRHNTNTDRWFYLYARNTSATAAVAAGSGGAASFAAASFQYFYYTKEAGETMFSSQGAGGALGAFSSAQAGVTPIIWLNTARTLPICTVIGMNANVPSCAPATPGTRCLATFDAQVRWGLPQEAWPSGSVSLLQAVESRPQTAATGGTSLADPTAGQTGTTFGDSFNNTQTLALSDTAPVQSATGVTNLGTTASPGARSVGTTYTISQTISDTNADLLSGSLVFVFTSGSQSGQWFQVGWSNGDNNDNTINVTTGSSFYQSSFETARTATYSASLGGSTPLTTTYLSNFTASATCNTATAPVNAGLTGSTASGAGCSSETISYVLSFSSSSAGSLTVYGNAGDFHGLNSGNVGVGALTVS